MNSQRLRLFFAFALPLACWCAAGCGSAANNGEDAPPPTECQKRLIAIGKAYVGASAKNNRPPRNAADLLPFLKEAGKPDELLKSPDDGQNFEIVYGSSILALKETGSDVPIVAYERTGKNGQRNVLRGNRETLLMSESELKSGKFPEGYKFPF